MGAEGGAMKRIVKWAAAAVLLLIFCVVGYGVYFVETTGTVGTGYGAKVLCSSVFLSGRDPAEVSAVDLAFLKAYHVTVKVDRSSRFASASILGLAAQNAVYRPGLGCTITHPSHAAPAGTPFPAPYIPAADDARPWPEGEAVVSELPSDVDQAKLKEALDFAFAEPDPARPLRTRAVVVVYQGRLVAERYAPGFTRDTRLQGWSMTKSVTNALVGILVKQGKLDLNAPAPVPEWADPADPRHAITLDHLLRMSSGLRFLEEYESTPKSDCNLMLFIQPDAAAFAAAMPLAAPPGSKWSYSSGTANILSRIVRQAVLAGGQPLSDYFAFPRAQLFDRIGMRSAVLEPDASGTFVGSSFMYATARDWARFGLLFANDGVCNGERILPEGWVKYSVTPTPSTPPAQGYGAQWWLNSGGDGRWMPRLPTDIYSACGHESQYVTVIPSAHLVVVRLGLTSDPKAWDHQAFLEKILAAVH
jgi:CubicO group peptidase (beta-lactamase class C family)